MLYRMVVWAAIVFVAVGHLGCALTLILACQPVHKSWDPMRPGTCLPSGPSFTAYAIVTIISDIIVAVIPIPVLLQLKVSIGKKIGLIAIFMLGLFTTLCSVFRYLQINRIQYGDGNSTMLIVWGVIEFNVGVCLSSLTPNSATLLIVLFDLRTEHRVVPPLPRPHPPAQGPQLHEQVLGRQRQRRQQQRQGQLPAGQVE